LLLKVFVDNLHMLRPPVCPPLEIWKPYTFIMMSDLRPVYPSKEIVLILETNFPANWSVSTPVLSKMMNKEGRL
jgi:hypothetical protein